MLALSSLRSRRRFDKDQLLNEAVIHTPPDRYSPVTRASRNYRHFPPARLLLYPDAVYARSRTITSDTGSAPRLRQSRLKVVVVDDHQESRELVATAVERFGHSCRMAQDGLEALRLLEQEPADVVISDWDMPVMTGAELCRRVRAQGDDAPYTYFIMMTGLGDREHLLQGMKAGADDYQQKPAKLDELEARLISAGRVVELHSRLRADNRRHFEASRTDALTGIPNRLHLDEELRMLLARARRYKHRCSIAVCDIDFFKQYNDAFGHVAGDVALRSVAQALRANLRDVDAVYRYGGEEFVVVLLEQPLAEAERVMERMRLEIEKLKIAAPDGVVTMSVGVAELDIAQDRTPEQWIARADEALYEAKSKGRNRVVSTRPPPPSKA